MSFWKRPLSSATIGSVFYSLELLGLIQSSPLAPPLRAEVNTWQQINWFLQPGRPSPVAPAPPLQMVLAQPERFQDPLGCCLCSCPAQPSTCPAPGWADTPANLLGCGGRRRGAQGGREGPCGWQEPAQTLPN